MRFPNDSQSPMNAINHSFIAIFLLASLLVAPAIALEPAVKQPPTKQAAASAKLASLAWHAVAPADVVGQGWKDTKAPFDRLPARAEKLVREPVWDLSHHSAGLYVDFTTNAKTISARWTLTSDRLAMSHMPATGVSGVALYTQRDDKWHYLATGRPTKAPTNELVLTSKELAGETSNYRLYFPLYNGVSAVEIGVPKGSSFEFQAPPKDVKPVVIYGTSITQGGCASQPGMSFAAILGRRLNVPVINLGFSGNGKTEQEMAELLSELDPSVYVLDPLPNLFPEQVDERMPTFIQILRKSHPNTPILLNEYPRQPGVPFFAKLAEHCNKANSILQRIGKERVAAGDQNIAVIAATDLAADTGETTVDGLHPTDFGFIMLADAIEPALRKALGK